jgi:amino acid adenylation domain-containing protein
MSEIEDLYELSPMQQGILFHCLAASDPSVYLVTVGYALHGRLNVDAFEQAWQRVVDRNPTLRTSLHWANTQKPLQAVHREVRLRLERHDWRAVAEAEQVERLSAYVESGGQGFELDQAPLMRVTLIQTAEGRYRLFWTFHHVVLEGWSASLVLEEVFAFYRAFSRGQDLDLPARRPYRDYILWLQRQDASKAEAYWRQALKGFSTTTTLELGSPSQDPNAGTGCSRYSRRLWPATSNALQVLAQRNQLTLNTILQGAWAILLSRYSGQEDVLFGSVVSGRQADLRGAESMIGLFVNTLPARVRVRPGDRLLDWLKELQVQQLEMRKYEYSSLVEVQGWSEVPRGSRLFETLFAFENWLGDVSLRDRAEDLEVLDVRSVPGTTDYPLTVAADPGLPLSVAFTYDRRRFDEATIARMSAHYQTLLEGMIANPGGRLSELPLLTEGERRQMVEEWNETGSEYPRQAGIGDVFAEQVKRSPEAEAATFGGERQTYGELNRRANQLARRLRSLGVGPEVRVGLCVERSLQMVVGMLGIVKAGGAYVPLDPSYPRERLAFMLEDSAVEVLLTQESLLSELPGARTVVCLDRDWAQVARESEENLASGADGDNLAYVIYTSGSTGLPKGVGVSHRCVTRLVLGTDYVKVEAGDRIAQAANASFDAATFEVWGALLNGACVVGISREVSLSPREMASALGEQGITALFLTTALFNQIAREEVEAFSRLKHLLFGGEAVDPDSVRRVLEKGRPSRLLHVYGPTETTTFATWHLVQDVAAGAITVPIGRPIANTRSYVLDEAMRPVSVGVSGELYLGGDGLARGYLGRPEATAERFVPDPFAAEGGGRLYRTGDLVRYRGDGTIEFLGRKDHQVKVRGYRIELGEIEAALSSHPSVALGIAVAVPHEEWGKAIVAFVVSRDGAALTQGQLRRHVGRRLPRYMVPVRINLVAELPRTSTGKVDRQVLAREAEAAALASL